MSNARTNTGKALEDQASFFLRLHNILADLLSKDVYVFSCCYPDDNDKISFPFDIVVFVKDKEKVTQALCFYTKPDKETNPSNVFSQFVYFDHLQVTFDTEE
jgi:hypothetical protein